MEARNVRQVLRCILFYLMTLLVSYLGHVHFDDHTIFFKVVKKISTFNLLLNLINI